MKYEIIIHEMLVVYRTTIFFVVAAYTSCKDIK